MADASGLVTAANAGSWDSLGVLSPLTLSVLAEQGFVHMTPVQAAVIPQLLSHKDVSAEAVTGSGKTLAFVVPITEMLLRAKLSSPKLVGAVVLSPTRELATQIISVLEPFATAVGFSTLLLTGGTDPQVDVAAFNSSGGNVIVATPGRLEDILRRVPSLPVLCKALELLVLDEADRLLDLGFTASINTILSYLPKQRRTGLFSATQTKEVDALIRAGLRNPVRVAVRVESKDPSGAPSSASTAFQAIPATLSVFYTVIPATQKLEQLLAFLESTTREAPTKFIVYFLTCACVDYFSRAARPLIPSVPILTLHGKVPASSRNQTFEKFSKLAAGALFCTDVAARGLDIPNVDWVVQFDPPQKPDAFVHRCGRTARNGKDGAALVFLQPEEDAYSEFLNIRKVPMTLREPIELDDSNPIKNCLSDLRKRARSNREIYERGRLAFVSYVRGYKEHQCSYIFQAKKLDLGVLATGFGLLHLPAMPEIRGGAVPRFEPDPIEPDSIQYQNKEKEKHRQVALAKLKAEGGRKAKVHGKKGRDAEKSEPWSKKKDQKARKEKRKARKAFAANQAAEPTKVGGDDEWDEDDLAAEARAFKKLKQGKMSKADYLKFNLDEDTL